MEKYKVSLYCYTCKYTWTTEVEKGKKVHEHPYGSTIVADNVHFEDVETYRNSIICPNCGCKSGVKKA